MRIFRASILLVSVLCAAAPMIAEPPRAYIYDEDGYALPAPEPYTVETYFDFASLETGPLTGAADIVTAPDGSLFVSDPGAKRILRILPTGRLLSTISHPEITKPTGLFMHEKSGRLYVADPGSRNIYRLRPDGTIDRVYPPPSADVLPDDFLYAPHRLVVDQRDWLYVVGQGTSSGIIQFDPDGNFRGFFGANRVAFNLGRWLRKRFATEAQQRMMWQQSLVPATDIAHSPDGFLFTVTANLALDQIKKLTPIGTNVYPSGYYGEKLAIQGVSSEVVSQGSGDVGGGRWGRQRTQGPRLMLRDANLVQIAVSRGGIVTVLDGTSNKLFQYDEDGNLLFLFGGTGRQLGTFSSAVSIAFDKNDDSLYVLDGNLGGSLQRFRPTQFAQMVYAASSLHADGRYEEAVGAWLDVLAKNTFYPLANRGVAKALERLGIMYASRPYLNAAREFYRRGADKAGYSATFREYRELFMRDRFGAIIIFGLGIIVVLALSVRWLPRLANRYSFFRAVKLGFGTVSLLAFHPFRSAEMVREEYSRRQLIFAATALVAFWAAHILRLYFTAYHFSTWDSRQLTLVGESTKILLPWLSWCISVFLVTELFDGESSFGQICVFSAYSLVPGTLLLVVLMAMSNALSLKEAGTYAFVETLTYIWIGAYLVLGMTRVNGYSFRKGISLTGLSVVGIVLLWGVGVLIYGLVGSMVEYGIQIVREVAGRA